MDDHINGIKYVIERDGTVKFISGVKREVNIYDQRDAVSIAERVKRMFGQEHKYSNYRRFLKGYQLVESFEEFSVNELWSSGIRRSSSGNVRREDGIRVEFPLGSVVLDDKGCGIPYKIDGENYCTMITAQNTDMYIFGYSDDTGGYTYFRYNPDNDDEDTLEQIAVSDYDMYLNDFDDLIMMIESDFTDFPDDYKFESYDGYVFCLTRRNSYCIYDDERNFNDFLRSQIEENFVGRNGRLDQDTISEIDKYLNDIGDDFLDRDMLSEEMEESNRGYVNDIESEHGDMGNRLYDELEYAGIIKDNEDFFDTDEDGELDYDSPKFDVDEMKDEYAEQLNDKYDDPLDWYRTNFGDDGLEYYVNTDKFVDMCLDKWKAEDILGRDVFEYRNFYIFEW